MSRWAHFMNSLSVFCIPCTIYLSRKHFKRERVKYVEYITMCMQLTWKLRCNGRNSQRKHIYLFSINIWHLNKTCCMERMRNGKKSSYLSTLQSTVYFFSQCTPVWAWTNVWMFILLNCGITFQVYQNWKWYQ